MLRRLKSRGFFLNLLFILVFLVSCQPATEETKSPDFPSESSSESLPKSLPKSPTATRLPPQTPTESLKINEINQLIQSTIDQLFVGKLLSNIPQEMTVNQTEIVEVRIAGKAPGNFAKNLQGKGKPIIQNVKFATTTEIKLLGSSFDIQEILAGRQVVGGEEYTEWSWYVTPKESGEQTLTLIISAAIKIPELGIDSVKNYPVEVKTIQVKINKSSLFKDLFKNNWSDILALLFGSGSLAGLIGWILAKRNTSKKSNNQLTVPQKDTNGT